MQIQNAVITGSFSYNGVDISSITSSTSNITSLNAITASILSTTASLNTASGSAITRLSALEVTSGSNITRISALETASGSAITRLGALETASGSAITRLSSLESKTGSYATTGSNTFVDGQYLSSSFNPTGFSTTASLYTDGGLRVTRDAYISGTLYLNNVTVYGTQSVCYITSSQLNIASNLISVNTATPSVRFGGLAVYDSGSTGLTGSILWDSQNNHWVYSNPSGSTYSGGMFISGPRTSTLGSETGTTSCMLLAGQGGDHLTSSMIYHDSAITCIPNYLIGGTVCINANLVVQQASTFCNTLGLFGGSSQLYIGGSSGASDFAILQWCATDKSLNIHNQSTGNSPQLIIACNGNVSIGTTDSNYKLRVEGTLYSLNAARFNGVVFSDCRLMVGVAGNDQTYANIFVGGALTSGTSQYALLLDPQLSGTTNYGILANARIKASTAATNAYGVYILNNEILSGASIVNNYGLYIANQTNGSSINYALYSAGGANYFGGCVGINCTTPSYVLDVNGAGRIALNLRVGGAGYGVGNENDPAITNAVYTNAGIYFACCGVGLGVGSSKYLFMNSTGTISYNNPDTNSGTYLTFNKNITAAVGRYAQIKIGHPSYGGYIGNLLTGPDVMYLSMCDNPNACKGVYIDSNGYLGIRNSTPNAPLEVGMVCGDTTSGGLLFKSLELADNTWTTFLLLHQTGLV